MRVRVRVAAARELDALGDLRPVAFGTWAANSHSESEERVRVRVRVGSVRLGLTVTVTGL